MKPKKTATNAVAPSQPNAEALVTDLRELILSARQTVARGMNATLVVLHWQIGRRIHQDILNSKRAEYGEEILQTLSAKLGLEFGRGFAQRNLASMVQFAEAFPDENSERDLATTT